MSLCSIHGDAVIVKGCSQLTKEINSFRSVQNTWRKEAFDWLAWTTVTVWTGAFSLHALLFHHCLSAAQSPPSLYQYTCFCPFVFLTFGQRLCEVCSCALFTFLLLFYSFPRWRIAYFSNFPNTGYCLPRCLDILAFFQACYQELEHQQVAGIGCWYVRSAISTLKCPLLCCWEVDAQIYRSPKPSLLSSRREVYSVSDASVWRQTDKPQMPVSHGLLKTSLSEITLNLSMCELRSFRWFRLGFLASQPVEDWNCVHCTVCLLHTQNAH